MRRYLITAILFLLLVPFAHSQLIRTRLDFIGGFAYPEYLHTGIRYQYLDVAQIGLYYGGDMGIKPEIIRTWTIDHFYHFGKHSYASNRPIWYARQGFTYSNHTTTDMIYKYYYLNFALGREFSITQWLGFNTDLGFLAQVIEKQEFRGTNDKPHFHSKWDWLPLLGFQVFISI
jgi:hypothetical protein